MFATGGTVAYEPVDSPLGPRWLIPVLFIAILAGTVYFAIAGHLRGK